jgi:hypothetical protein
MGAERFLDQGHLWNTLVFVERADAPDRALADSRHVFAALDPAVLDLGPGGMGADQDQPVGPALDELGDVRNVLVEARGVLGNPAPSRAESTV